MPFDFEEAIEKGVPLTVALIDVDYFGAVNKEHGWPTGDRVLSEVSERVRKSVRSSDWVARYGGEELCIVMYGTDIESAQGVLERVRSVVAARPFEGVDGVKLDVTVSIGAAQCDGAEVLDTLMQRVSEQLLTASAAAATELSPEVQPGRP